ncbi:hypothetical protein [Solimonas terrae]|uniref:Uncharacterized protein n=1 Tax=Solimonas terrae TaxID=1396819 RepID=A0A6M2BSC2_9GAMM|nr:hypothetical protein [Solimonas terrae]NGY04897.1 hypothetical protein [Solimonas terrae]
MKGMAVAALASLAFTAIAADPVKVTGMYSNMHFATEDVIGVEVFIVYSRNEYQAVVQCSEGAVGVPQVVPLSVSGSSVSFTVTSELSGCPTSSFTGVVTKSGLQGSFAGTENYPGLLKRGRSYWQ